MKIINVIAALLLLELGLTAQTVSPATTNRNQTFYGTNTFRNQTLLATESGSVGIGTNSPKNKLDIVGNVGISGTNSYIKFLPRARTVPEMTMTTNLNTAFLYGLTNSADRQIWVLDGGGTHTQITPHSFLGPTTCTTWMTRIRTSRWNTISTWIMSGG